MSKTDDVILRTLTHAERDIATAKALIEGPPPPDGHGVDVMPGDNLLQMIADNPENTLFNVSDDFIQDCGQTEFAKPCTLRSTRARIIAILAVKPRTHFVGMTIDGATTGTILTGADDTTLDNCVLNGNVGGQHRGVLANCRGMRIRNTQILNIQADIDTQAIAGWNRTNDLQVIGCALEASGENFLLGGDASESEEAMPRNVRVSGCHLFKKPEWRASPATCKNLIELKVGVDVVLTDNVLDFSFVDGQVGYAIVLTVRNEYGTSPWSTIRNLVAEKNLIRHVAGGFSILGRDDRGASYPSQVMTNVRIANNTVEDLSAKYGYNGRQIFISGGPDALTIDGNSFSCPDTVRRTAGSETPNSALCFDQPQHLCTGLIVKNQVQFVEGAYGIFGTGAPGLGTPAIEMYAPGYQWENNRVLKSGSNISWPPGTIFI